MSGLIRFFLITVLVFLPVGVSLAAAGENDFYGDEVPYEPEGKLAKMMDAYSKEQKIQAIKQSSEIGIAGEIFRNHWDLISEIGDPGTATIHAMAAKEPFQKKIVDVLERLYPKADDEETRFQMALLLYRYKRKPGKDYLIKLLREQKNDFAAVILAENREEEALEDLKTHFTDMLRSGKRVPVRLIWGLGRFGYQADEILIKGLLKKKNRRHYSIALCLDRHKASPPVEKDLLRALGYGDGVSSGGDRFLALAALLNLHPENRDYQKAILPYFQDWDHVYSNELFVALNVVVRHDIHLERISGDLETNIRRNLVESKPDSIGIVVEALRVLLKIHHKKAISLAFSAFEKMKENPPASDHWFALGQAIAAMGDPEADRRLDALLGKGTAMKYRKINQLNIVPNEFLPDSNFRSSILERYVRPDEFIEPPDIPKPDKKGFRNIQRSKFMNYVQEKQKTK